MITVCIPTKDAKSVDLEKLNLKVLGEYQVIFSEVKGLSNARNDLMTRVQTDWFLFIDDDIEINQEWWDRIKPYMNDETVGAVNGLGFANSAFLRIIRKTLLFFRGDNIQRGFTSNTLIRTDVVRGVTLKRVGRLEDMELQEIIKEKGFKWILEPKAVCKHLKPARTVLKEAWGDFKIIVKERGIIAAIRRI